ncbi:tRNA pseudouridine(55) synthase TruB [Haloimpatiens lingqiaonensis]|uniref:tRNA pseudouridine(55) synthase TruB n=1 Tax=Haloimpatiens lingqiaonensis TaxID=1380675 RepID=UPI0010FD5195|nr:tRNA pseudouridine(55) synthase TruB [Haloimpatiens lingqiaonensis]
MDGVLNIYKPEGITSFDVVKSIRKITGEKKVGHAGTLDPMASGILPVCLGKGTKIIEYIMENHKVYVAKLKLGIITDTYDREGKSLEEKPIDCINKKKIEETIKSFVGVIEQVPPMYSALKVNGKRLYELARKGIEIERTARQINIDSIDILEIEIPYIKFKVQCSKGTYIRSLCYDIGKSLGVGATMWELERVENGPFKKENSQPLSNINPENIKEFCISIEEALNKYPKLSVKGETVKLLRNGVQVKNKYLIGDIPLNKMYRIYDEESFMGIGIRTVDGLKISKLLS